MRALDVVAQHADLLERTRDRRMQHWIDGNAKDNLRMPGQATAEGTGRVVHNHLKVATAYHVEPAMLDVALRRAEHDLDSATPVAGYLPQVRHGFCVLGAPWWIVADPGRTQCVHALTWGAVRSGILVTAWTDASRDKDDVWNAIRHALEAERSAASMAVLDQVQGPWVISNVTIITWDDLLGPPTQKAATDAVMSARHTDSKIIDILSVRRVMCTLWGMFDEVLPGAVREPVDEPDRRTRKLAKRLAIPTAVEMVRLRREETRAEHPGTGTPWRVRTMVEGHPRTYHRGTEREYTIWIPEHPAGPKDAPWSMRRTVKNLSR